MSLKSKRGLFFVGQPHHMRLWNPVLEKLKQEGMEILYITTHAYFPFEVSALDYGIKPMYIEDLLTEKDKIEEEKIYKQVSKELADIQKNTKYLNWFSPNLTTKTLRHIVRETILFKKFLEKEKIDAIFALHELNRWSKYMAYLSFKKGIPFITLQEGAYYIKSFGLGFHTEYSSVNLVWGQQTIDILRETGNAPEKNLIVGDTHLDSVIKQYFGKEKYFKNKVCKDLDLDPSKPLIYIIQGTGSEILEVPIGAIVGFMKMPKEYNYVLKFHPNAQRFFVENFKEKYARDNFRIVQNYNSYELLSASDVCITAGLSTLTFEAFAFGKPLIETIFEGTEPFYGKFGICKALEPQYVEEEVKNILDNGIDEKTKENINKFVEYVFYKVDGKSTARVINSIKFIIDENEFYKRYKPKKLKLKPKSEKRVSYNIVALGNVNILSETLNNLLNFINPEKDEINIIFPSALEKLYIEIKNSLEGKGIINFYLSTKKNENLSSLYNQLLEISNGSFIFLFKEGLIPLKIGLNEEMLNYEGFLGSVIIDPNNKVKHLGVTFEHNNVVYRLYEDLPINKIPIKSREFKALDYVIAGKKESFKKVGTFDEKISDYYSIIDYTLTASYNNLKNKVDTNLFFGMVSNFSLTPITQKDHIQFYTKWRGKTEHNVFKYTEEDKTDLYKLYHEV